MFSWFGVHAPKYFRTSTTDPMQWQPVNINGGLCVIRKKKCKYTLNIQIGTFIGDNVSKI